MDIKGKTFFALSLPLFILILLTRTVEAKEFRYPPSTPTTACIVIDLDFSIKLEAIDGTTAIDSVTFSQDDVINVSTGNCGNINSNAVMRLLFNDEVTWSLIFRREPNGRVILDRLLQFVPVQVFGDKVDDTNAHFLNDPGTTQLSDSNSSYVCDTPQTVRYTNGTVQPDDMEYAADVTVSKIHAQAFNVVNGNFSPAERCPEDSGSTQATSSTASPASSSSPASTSPETGSTSKTTPAPSIPVNTYVIKSDNTSCILLEGAISFSIKYPLSTPPGETNTITVDIPPNPEYTGNCDLTFSSQSLAITFLNDWTLEIVFDTDSSSDGLGMFTAASKIDTYKISNMTLTYVIDPTRFPNAELLPGTKVMVMPDSEVPDFPRKSADTGYYSCNSKVSFSLNEEVAISTRKLKFRAFNEDSNEVFDGSPDDCSIDQHTSHSIPIAVGCSLAAILVTAFLIFSIVQYKNSKSGYAAV